jgi:hypothetical protein
MAQPYFLNNYFYVKNRGSIVGTAAAYGLDDRGAKFESWQGKEFSLLHIVQTSSVPTSYPMGTDGSFPGRKVAAA